MNAMQNNTNKILEMFLWIAIGLVTIAAFIATYYFNLSAPIKALVWVVWCSLAFGIGAFTKQGKHIIVFAKESKVELLKVVWPTRQETVQTTSIVMIMVAVTGFILWGIDSGMMWIIGKLTHLG